MFVPPWVLWRTLPFFARGIIIGAGLAATALSATLAGLRNESERQQDEKDRAAKESGDEKLEKK